MSSETIIEKVNSEDEIKKLKEAVKESNDTTTAIKETQNKESIEELKPKESDTNEEATVKETIEKVDNVVKKEIVTHKTEGESSPIEKTTTTTTVVSNGAASIEELKPIEADEAKTKVNGRASKKQTTPAKSDKVEANKKTEEKKTPLKPKVEKKQEEDVDNEDEEDEEEEEPKVALLERTLEVTGKRERKSTQRLEFTQTPTRKVKELEQGTGTMLGDLPRVVFFMDRKDHAETLGLLYRTIYGGAKCKKNELKKNLKKFNGFSFDEKSPEYEKKYDHAIKIFNTTQLKKACELLDIERGGTKGELLDRVFKFLLAPHKSEHEGLPQPAKRKSKGKRTKRSSKKPKATKKEAKEGEEPEEGDEEGEGEDDGSEGSEESGDEEEGKEANDKSMVNEEDSENETDEEIEEELYPKSSSKKGKGKATPQKPAITPAKATTVRAKSPAIEKNTKATPAKKITNGTPSKVAQVEEKKSATPKSRKTKVIKKDEEEEEENSDEDEEVEEKKKEMPKKSTKATKAPVEKPTTPDSKAPAVPSSNKKRSRTEDKTTEKTATAEASKKPKENGHHVTEAEKKTNGSAPLPGSTLKRASPTKTNGTKLDASEEDEVVKPVAKKAKAALNTSNDGPNEDDLRKTIKEIIDNSDLDSITIKTVIQEVNAKYPKNDLTDKKAYIKNVIKEIIEIST